MARVRRRAHEDIQRELDATRLAAEHDSIVWLNDYLQRSWITYRPTPSATVISAVDQDLVLISHSRNFPPSLFI